MRFWWRRLRYAAALSALCAAVVLYALTICPDCGYEQRDGANFCAHCGARIVAVAEGAVAGAPGKQPEGAPAAERGGAPGIADLAGIVADAVREDVLLARSHVAEGRPDIAREVLRNALALVAVEPGAITRQQGEALLSELKECEGSMTLGSRTCQDCGGSGKRVLRVAQITGEMETSLSTGQTCATCRGTGKVRVKRSMEELKLVMGQARQRMEAGMRTRGRIAVGGAWVPPGMEELPDDATEARLRHAAAAPCGSCQGLGRTDCNKCGNTGTVPCTARGCDQGWVMREELNKLGEKTQIRRREPCPVCKGTARVECRQCNGIGAQTCRTCNGTGKRAICNSCGGDGIAKCRICRGEGRKRDGTPCAECGGDGIVLCPACRGDGYRKR